MLVVFKLLLHINACSNNLFYLQLRLKRVPEKGLLPNQLLFLLPDPLKEPTEAPINLKKKRELLLDLFTNFLQKPTETTQNPRETRTNPKKGQLKNPMLHGYCLFVLTVLVLHIMPSKRSIQVDFREKN